MLAICALDLLSFYFLLVGTAFGCSKKVRIKGLKLSTSAYSQEGFHAERENLTICMYMYSELFMHPSKG